MTLVLHNPSTVVSPLGLYSHSVEVPAGVRLVFVSGQAPVRPDGTAPRTLSEQADLVYANIVAVLAAKGAKPSDIVKLTVFLVDDDEDNVVSAARRKHLGRHRPASTAVWVRRLVDPAWLIEIDAVAVLPDAASAE